MNLNKVQLIGRVGKDPELKGLPSGSSVCSFSMATTRSYKDKNQEKQESTEWHNIVSWGKQAETIAQYVRKGALLYIEGRIETRSWEGEGGKKQYRTEIIVENFQFGPKSQNSGERTERADDAPIEYAEEKVNIDDIPF